MCISSVSFEVLVNGGKTDHFKPSRGLRQGDPLSSYLFILGQEVLSRILDYELAQNNISGIKASIRGPSISHVMYADDIIMFSKASKKEATNFIKCVDKYCRWSGQKINNNKSGVFFSKNTPGQNRRMIKGLLQMKGLKIDAIYPGSPLFRSRAPSKDFKFLQEKLESKLMGWRSRCLSWAGRSTLIKFVAQALPNYTMSAFSVPNTICDKLDTLTRYSGGNLENRREDS